MCGEQNFGRRLKSFCKRISIIHLPSYTRSLLTSQFCFPLLSFALCRVLLLVLRASLFVAPRSCAHLPSAKLEHIHSLKHLFASISVVAGAPEPAEFTLGAVVQACVAPTECNEYQSFRFTADVTNGFRLNLVLWGVHKISSQINVEPNQFTHLCFRVDMPSVK